MSSHSPVSLTPVQLLVLTLTTGVCPVGCPSDAPPDGPTLRLIAAGESTVTLFGVAGAAGEISGASSATSEQLATTACESEFAVAWTGGAETGLSACMDGEGLGGFLPCGVPPQPWVRLDVPLAADCAALGDSGESSLVIQGPEGDAELSLSTEGFETATCTVGAGEWTGVRFACDSGELSERHTVTLAWNLVLAD